MKLDAAILIGDRGRSRPIHGDNKNFLEVKGLPLFFYAIKALEESRYVQKIFIVGDQERIRKTVDLNVRLLNSPEKIIPLEQKRNLFENIFVAFDESVALERKNHGSAGEDKVMLFLPGDTPLITAQEVDEFLEKCDITRFDYFLGMSTEEGLKHFYPTGGEKGINMAYFYAKEKKYRQNNLHLVKPQKVRNRPYIQNIYDHRYQKEFINFVKLLWAFYRANVQIRGIWYYLILHGNLFVSCLGLESLTSFLRQLVSVEDIEQVVGDFLGCRFTIVETRLPGAALDIDNEKDYETLKSRFDYWRNYQDRLFKNFKKETGVVDTPL